MLLARLRFFIAFFLLVVPASFAFGSSTPAATPTFSVGGGTYSTYKSVTISDATTGASIYYTVTGVTPTVFSTKYTGPVTVNRNMTLKAIAAVSGGTASSIASATYSFTAAAAPTFSAASGTYQNPPTVTISDSTPGASIFYTTTGVTPTALSTPYTGPITVSSNMTLQAIAVVVGGPVSGVTTAFYTIVPAAMPTFSTGQGSYLVYKTVSISDSTPGASIYYTTSGVTPTVFSARYTGPITVNRNMTLKAIAAMPNGPASPIASAAYTFTQAAAPTFSLADGTYQGWQKVTISSSTPSTTIFYTTTGTTPTVFSTHYTGPITVKGNITINAIAVVLGGPTSLISSANYTIVPQSTPVMTPNSAGSFFGLSIDHLLGGTAWPNLPLGTIRLWDSGTKWGNLNPAEGTYKWTNLDKQINMARANGSEIIYTLGGTPPWAIPTNVPVKSIVRSGGVVTVTTSAPHGMYFDPTQSATRQSKVTIAGVADGTFNGSFYVTGTPGVYTLTYAQTGTDGSSSAGTLSAVCGGAFAPNMCAQAPASLSQWDEYVTQLANHVGPGSIQFWELWNEANDPIYWQGDPKTLVAMAADAHRIIKAVDPAAIFLSPSFTGAYETSDECLNSVQYCGTTWIDNWLSLGGKSYVDVVAFHGYPNIGVGPEQIQGGVYQVLAAMGKNGVGSLPMWDTESSWANNSNFATEADRAAWLAKHFLLEQSIGVQRTLWYAYDTPTWGTLWSSAGGMNTAGYAFREVSAWLTGTTLTQACAETSSDPTTYVCGYSRSSGYVAQAVWNTAGPKSYTVPSQFIQYRDIYGNIQPISGGTVEISTSPILLESSSAF